MEQSAFKGHGIWASLTALEASINRASERENPTVEPQIGQLRYLAAWVRSHDDPSDVAPYSSAGLAAVQGQINSVNNEVTNYANNGNVAHLTNADQYADQALNALGSWPTSVLRGGAAAQASRVFAEYRDAAEEALVNLRSGHQELKAKLDAQKTEAQQAIDALKAQVAALSTKVTEDEARLDKALTTTNDAFTSKQTEREERFQAFIEKQAAALKDLTAQDLDEISGLVGQAQEAYEEVDRLRQGTEKVAGLASADILAGKFREYATQQWRWGLLANGLGFLALAAGLAVIWLTLNAVGRNEPISWQYTTLKLGVTLTIVAASAVAFRLGALFLSRSSTSKRMELELRAIGPFFADIDDPEALKSAKQAFVERSFGRGWDIKHEHGTDATNETTSALLREIVELVRTVTARN